MIINKLNLEQLRIIAYSDALFTNNEDLKSQLVFVILLTDETKRVNWSHYRSYRCERAVRSVLASETHPFLDAFDALYAMRYDLNKSLGGKLPLTIILDSDSLFKVIVQY